jgi:hypothetical protein
LLERHPEIERRLNEEMNWKSMCEGSWKEAAWYCGLLVQVLHLRLQFSRLMSGGKKAITINAYLFSDHQMISLNFKDQKKNTWNPELTQGSGSAEHEG